MLHLQTELSNRRDKRLELARLRRDYEVANVTKRRKLDEDGVWSWWKVRTRPYASVECASLTRRIFPRPALHNCSCGATSYKPR